MFKKLLVPIDGSELSARQIEQSVALARQLGAGITGFTALPPSPKPSAGVQVGPSEPVESVEQLRTEEIAQRLLNDFECSARNAGVPFDGHYQHTHEVDAAITQVGQEHGCDLIVLMSHGRGPFNELLFGSHTKGVMARSNLPILMLR